MMYIIAGLGNPGSKYAHTRHNVGFDTVEYLADYYGIGIIETLTGFKYIGEQIKFFEEEKKAGRKDVPEDSGCCPDDQSYLYEEFSDRKRNQND